MSYFAFTYPFQRFVLGFLLTAIVLSLIAAAVVHYLFGGRNAQPQPLSAERLGAIVPDVAGAIRRAPQPAVAAAAAG